MVGCVDDTATPRHSPSTCPSAFLACETIVDPAPTAIVPDTFSTDVASNFVVGLHAALAVDVPEADYAQLASLDACVAYLAAKRGE